MEKRDDCVHILFFFFQYMHYKEAFTYLCCPRFLSNSLLLLRQFVYPSYVLSICIAMSLRIAQCTSSSQQSVTGSIFQRPHGKKALKMASLEWPCWNPDIFPTRTTTYQPGKWNEWHDGTWDDDERGAS